MTTMMMPNTVETAPTARVGKELLRAWGLRKRFGGLEVLTDVSIALREGEVVLLRGDNGSGKTTLLNILTGALDADGGTMLVNANHQARRVSFPRGWLKRLSPLSAFSLDAMARHGIARAWQDIRLFDNHTLIENLALSAPDHPGESPFWALARPALVRRKEQSVLSAAREDLARLGLGGREQSRGDRVSLGQAKRVAIARAARAGARILFLDEPLAGLDASGVDDVLDLLQELVRTHSMTLVIVEHVLNIPLVRPLATTVWTLQEGRLSVSSADEVEELGTGARLDPPALLRAMAGQPAPAMAVDDLPGGARLWRVDDARASGLEVEGVVVRRGARTLFSDSGGLTFRIPRGMPAVLEAPNGWGKTTLLDALAGLTLFHSGVVRMNGGLMDGLSPWSRSRAGLVYLQARANTFDNLAVREALRVAGAERAQHLVSHLDGRHASDLSGGERQRLAIACSLGGAPSTVALLDEPFASLDEAGIADAMGLLRAVASGTALLTVPRAAPGADASTVQSEEDA